MGGTCSKLFCLICCPPYLPSIVSKIAFSPPLCTYSVVRDSKHKHRIVINCNSFNFNKNHEKYVNYHMIKTREGDTISCLYLQTAPWTKNTILISHGNAVDIGLIADSLVHLGLKLKVNIITYDYSGYGTSSGSPSEHNLYSNIVCVLEYVHHNFDIPNKNIILYGQSIGSVPTIFLATKFQFGVVVIHSPLGSGFRFLSGCCRTLCGCCDVLNNVKRAKYIRCPVLIIHGLNDEITPVEHSYDLLNRIPSQLLLEPLFISGAGHNNCETFHAYTERLQHLINEELELFQNNFTDSIYRVK